MAVTQKVAAACQAAFFTVVGLQPLPLHLKIVLFALAGLRVLALVLAPDKGRS